MQEDRKQLMELAKCGDQQALAQLYEATYQKAYYIALRWLQDEDQAQDMLQDAYIKAFQNLHRFEGSDSAFQSWLDTIVINCCKDFKKAKAQSSTMLFSSMIPEEDPDAELEFADEAEQFSPEKTVDYQETKRLIREMIDELPEEQRMAIILCYLEEMPVKKIAEVMECAEGTVKSRLNYGRKAIKAKVEALEKRGTKLYCAPLFPFLYWMLREEVFSLPVPTASAKIMEAAVAASSATSVFSANDLTAQASASPNAAEGIAPTAAVDAGELSAVTGRLGTKASAAAGATKAAGIAVAGKAIGVKVAAVAAVLALAGGAGVALSHVQEETRKETALHAEADVPPHMKETQAFLENSVPSDESTPVKAEQAKPGTEETNQGEERAGTGTGEVVQDLSAEIETAWCDNTAEPEIWRSIVAVLAGDVNTLLQKGQENLEPREQYRLAEAVIRIAFLTGLVPFEQDGIDFVFDAAQMENMAREYLNIDLEACNLAIEGYAPLKTEEGYRLWREDTRIQNVKPAVFRVNRLEFLPNELKVIGETGSFDYAITESELVRPYELTLLYHPDGEYSKFCLENLNITDEYVQNEREVDGFILPDSDARLLTEQDLAGLTKAELRYARNEIYARKGRRFQDETMQAYFESKNWYQGFLSPEDFDEEVMLGEIEKENIRRIREAEDVR